MMWIVVHGEAYVPEAFESLREAEEFIEAADGYVSGPWQVLAGVGTAGISEEEGSLDTLKARWHSEVWSRGTSVDPDMEYDWHGVLIGFLIGAGLNVVPASDITAGAPQNGFDL